MNKLKKVLAILLVVLTVVTLPGTGVLAQELVDTVGTEEAQEVPVTDESQETPAIGETEQSVPVEEVPDTQEEVKGQLNYVYVDENIINKPETQNIAIGFVDETLQLEQVTLQYRSISTGEVLSMEATTIVNNTVLFVQEYDVESVEDSYELVAISYIVGGAQNTIRFADEKIEASYTVTSIPEEEVGEDVPEIKTYAIDEVGNTVEQSAESSEGIEAAVSTALEEAGAEPIEKSPSMLRSGGDTRKNLVVAISAGHDSAHTGAGANGLKEELLTLQVAQACKAELETYKGVTVYMTRTTAACPYPGGSAGSDNTARINAAVAAGANVYVDIHFNAGGGTGAEVYYPNQSVNSGISNAGKELAQAVQDQLVALGLPNRGIKIRNNTTGEKDQNGNLLDYYTTNNYCKKKGIPGIIVEHAFVDNAADAAKLKDPAFIKKLGIADATAVAKTYKLSKTVQKEDPKVKFESVNDFKGTFSIVASGLIPDSNVKEVRAYVWGAGQGSTDVHYVLKEQSNGTYTASGNKSKHKNYTGNYYVALYYVTTSGAQKELKSASTVLKNSSATLSVIAMGDMHKQFKASTKVTNAPTGMKTPQYAVWPAGKAAKWYTAGKVTSTQWDTTINVSDFGAYGTYYVDTYIELQNGIKAHVGSKTFYVAKPTVSNVSVVNKNETAGSFDVKVNQLLCPTGVQKLQVAVWNQGNSLKWYDAVKQSEGVYKVGVNLKDHQYKQGTYYADAYVRDGLGITHYLNGANVSMKLPQASITATDSAGTQKNFLLKASNIPALASAKKVEFAVWNQGGSAKWNTASKNAAGVWSHNVKVSDYKATGKYFADVYITLNNGQKQYAGSTTFNVTKPSASVSIANYNAVNGTFDVIATGVHAPSGVANFKIAVWNQTSDLKWYNAVKQSNGSYKIIVNIKNHKYKTGLYYADAYVVDGNNITTYVGGKRYTILARKATVTAKDTGTTQKQFALKATSIPYASDVKSVKFAVWRAGKGVKWYTGTKDSTGAWNTKVNISDFKLTGQFYSDVYATMANGESKHIGGTSFSVKTPVASAITMSGIDAAKGTFKVNVSGLSVPAGISKVQVPVWVGGGMQIWYTATKLSNGIYQADVNALKHGSGSKVFYADVYVTDGNSALTYVGGKNQAYNVGYGIMGTGGITVNQMVKYYKANSPISYPSGALGPGGASTIEQFCQIFFDEAKIENVKVEVAFTQAMLETGFLKFGGDVKIGQYNFAGLGAIGNGVPGNAFPSVRIGIRAQVQHLKCYASAAPLNQALVDQRWYESLRNKAPYVEWLSIPHNPYGTGWAADANYGAKLLNMITAVKKC